MFRSVLKGVLRSVLGLVYRVRLKGNSSAFDGHERQLIIANHESWLDGLLLGLFLPGNPVFVVYTGITGRLFFRMALSLVDYLTVDTSSPMAMKKVVELLKTGRPVVIFPEGRLSTTGALMKVYDGPAFAAVKSEATLIPVRLDGAGRTPFTRLNGLHPRKWFPRITITVQDPTSITVPAGLSAKARRKLAGKSMQRIMQEMLFKSAEAQTLYRTFLTAVNTFGRQRTIMADIRQLEDPTKTMKDYTYGDLLKMTVGLGRLVSKYSTPGECVGVLLPNLAVTLGLTLGTSAQGRVPAMLNYKAGAAGMQDACTAAAIKTVFTSRAFLQKAKLEAEVAELRGVTLVYLEDAREAFTLADKLSVLKDCLFPSCADRGQDIASPAVVLFTSGSEGKPKGVVLSHQALVSNIAQVRAVFDFTPEDRVLNALPIFHSFGLTGGTLLPLFSGLHLMLYATPLHYKVIPELAYDRSSTVLFGTNTFLANYGKHAHEYDFFRLRYVVAGAEKLQDAVRDLWFTKFGKRIFEGYGATETAPVLAVNTPMDYRPGTVGPFLPGIEYKLLPVPGIEQGGALHVRGLNVMSGYYRFENPGVLEPTSSEVGEGWYATGDIVKVEDGFVSIIDRVKRFAKIGGEMVSLSVVEKMAERASTTGLHAVTTQTDANKGEALVLFTTSPDLTREALSAAAREMGLVELWVPRKLVRIATLPLLGTGKTDYVTLKKMGANA